MKTALPAPAYPNEPTWMWTEEEHPNQTVLFRATVQIPPATTSVSLEIAAQTRYFAWLNGRYVGQGPCPTPWPDNIVDTYAVSPEGDSLSIAIIVYHYGVPTQSHPFSPPGLWCRLHGHQDGSREEIKMPLDQWHCLKQGGWLSTRLRRTWATAWMEQFDSSRHPEHWEAADFDHSHWPAVREVNRKGTTLSPRLTPGLREWAAPPRRLLKAAHVSREAPIADEGEGLLSKWLDEEAWDILPDEQLQQLRRQWETNKGIEIAASGDGLALLFDMGAEVSGQTEFVVKAKSGTVDHYGAELLRDGRPWAFRGNAEYATRWTASGRNPHFRTLNYNGFRYLLIVLRPDKSPMHFKYAGAWRREADIHPVSYRSDDPELQRLWDVSIRTIKVSTQETCIDCPTREQALFIADGLWNALWTMKLFHEPRYFEHFFEVISKSQHDNGLMPSALFSSLDPPHYLLDFCLIQVWAVDIYRRAQPGKMDIVKAALPRAEKTLRWFQSLVTGAGIIEAEPLVRENYPGGDFQIVFIDHPGLWHPFSHPGLERSTRQFGLNAFLIIALDAFYAAASACGYQHTLDASILASAKLRQRCQDLFWNESRQYYADCLAADNALKGWSAQSQILAILSGVITGEASRDLMARLIAHRTHPQLCRCTPYFWIYYSEALIVTGHQDQVMPLMREAWSGMNNDPETTTWWETFEGSPNDTRCHPWSALPAWHLQPVGAEFRLCPPAEETVKASAMSSS